MYFLVWTITTLRNRERVALFDIVIFLYMCICSIVSSFLLVPRHGLCVCRILVIFMSFGQLPRSGRVG